MCDDSHLFFAVAVKHAAAVIIVVFGSETVFFRNGEHGVKCRRAAFAVRIYAVRLAGNGINCDKLREVAFEFAFGVDKEFADCHLCFLLFVKYQFHCMRHRLHAERFIEFHRRAGEFPDIQRNIIASHRLCFVEYRLHEKPAGSAVPA